MNREALRFPFLVCILLPFHPLCPPRALHPPPMEWVWRVEMGPTSLSVTQGDSQGQPFSAFLFSPPLPGLCRPGRSLFLPPGAHPTLPSAAPVQKMGGRDAAGAVGSAGPIGDKCPGSPAPAADVDVLLGTVRENLPGNCVCFPAAS